MASWDNLPAVAPGVLIADKYRVERVLGRGGMGIVVAARHAELNQELAIKVLLPTATANPEATARFLREGRAAARLTSPHVAKVYDTGRLPSGEPYLVMEFLRGSDLKQVIERYHVVPVERAVAWILEAADALAEAHSLGIVHRDVKPSNIFLCETASGTIVKVLDFGISKQREAGDADLTGTGVSMGTPRYMAPEQMRSARHADARADIWALGAVLYELTTGKPPFTGDSMTEVIVEVLQTDPTLPSIENPAISPALDAIIKKCLEKKPDDRFASMQAFIEALRSVVHRAGAPGAYGPSSSGLAATLVDQRAMQHSSPGISHSQQPMVPSAAITPPAGAAPGADGTMRAWNVSEGRPRSSGFAGAAFAGVALVVAAVGGAGGYAWLHGRATTSPGSTSAGEARAPAAETTAPVPTGQPTAAAPPVIATTATAVPSSQPSGVASVGAPPTQQPVAVLAPAPQPAQRPVVVAPPPQQPPPTAPPPVPPAANCNPPFTIDAMGMRHAKPECL